MVLLRHRYWVGLLGTCASCGIVAEERHTPVQWVSPVEGSSILDLAPNDAGGVLIAAESDDEEVYFASLDEDGELLWETRRPSLSRGFGSPAAVGPDGNGGAVLVHASLSEECTDLGCPVVVALDANGEIGWERRLPASLVDGVDVSVHDGGILVVGLVHGADRAPGVTMLGEQDGSPSSLIARLTLGGELVHDPLVIWRSTFGSLGVDSAGNRLVAGRVMSPGVADWLEVDANGEPSACAVVAALDGDAPPRWARDACNEFSSAGPVVGLASGSAVVQSRGAPSPSMPGAVAIGNVVSLDESGRAEWSLEVPGHSDLAPSLEGGVFGASRVIYEIDASGKGLWQWPGSLLDGVPQQRSTGGLCNARIAAEPEGDLFVATEACASAGDLLKRHSETPSEAAGVMKQVLIARLRPNLVVDHEPRCGNGWLEDGEQCDGDFDGEGCSSFAKMPLGELRCTDDCKIDASGCRNWPCGDGVIDELMGEECEPGNLNGATCTSLGWGDGELRCSAGCMFDLTGCPGAVIVGGGAAGMGGAAGS